jgi:CBS domain-containing protein
MSRGAQDPERRDVARVDSFGTAHCAVSRDLVQCPRAEESVPAERCLTCPRALRLTYGRDGALASVTCAPDAQRSCEGPASTQVNLRRCTVGELMSRNVVCVRPQLSLDAAIQLFLETGLKAVPVVNERGGVLGMVDESDVQLAIHTHSRAAGDGRADVLTVEDVMMPATFAIHEHVPATQAAGLMVYEAVRRIPVVSAEGAVVGVLSASDILYWLARGDGYVLPSPRRERT